MEPHFGSRNLAEKLIKNMPESQASWWIYIVQCADRTFYTGCSPDVPKRILAHNSGKGAKYTRSRLPVSLIYTEQYTTQSEALKREAVIKKMTRKEKENLIR